MTWKEKLDEVQENAKVACLASLSKDKKALLVMATGTGKTKTALKVAEHYLGKDKDPILWLTHRTSLKNQAKATIESTFKLKKVEVKVEEFHGKERKFEGDIIVGMIPTLTNKNGKKVLEDYLEKNKFSLVIVDEVHHSPSKQFKVLLDLLSNKKIPMLGLTATPKRPDSLDLGCEHFLSTPACFTYSFEEAKKHGTIASPKGHVTLTDFYVKGARSPTNQEYNKKQLDRVIMVKGRDKIIIDKVLKTAPKFWKEKNLSPKYVCFCINIKHANRMKKEFNKKFKENGINFKAGVWVGSGKGVTAEKRKQTLKDFENNKINMLCVVDLMNEGVDVPDINTLIMCRPTFSNIVYTQQLGRGIRAIKDTCLVFDFVENYDNGFSNYTIATVDKTVVSRNDIDISYLSKYKDKIYLDGDKELQSRIDNIYKRIDEVQSRVFYTKEEAIELFKKLGITTRQTYREQCKKDSKLPLNPYKKYGREFWSIISGKPIKNPRNPRNTWTFKICSNSASKYKTIKEWKTKDSCAYNASVNHKWHKKIVDKYFPNRRKKHKWTSKECKKEFKRIIKLYKDKGIYKGLVTLWRKESENSYQAAKANGWYNSIIKLYKHKNGKKPVVCKKTGIVYPSIKEAAEKHRVTPRSIRAAIEKNKKSCGYHWKYV